MIGDTNVRAMPVARGTQISTLDVGTLVNMNINGTPWEWRIVHQGLPGDMYDQSCDGTWLLLQNVYEKMAWDSDNNDYSSSNIFQWLKNGFFPLLDKGIQSQIKEVKIPYVQQLSKSNSNLDLLFVPEYGEETSTVLSGENGLNCKIFLLSGYEVGWSNVEVSGMPKDGLKLGYFTTYRDDPENYLGKRIATYNDGSGANWWLRTPSPYDGTTYAFNITVTGDFSLYYVYQSSYHGVRPALILPSTALVDDNLNVLAA